LIEAGRSAGTRGALVWAIVACIGETPYRVWRGAGAEPIELPDATAFARQVRDTDHAGSQTLVIEARMRPILLLQDRTRDVLLDVVGLGLVGLDTLAQAQQTSVRDQREPSLFHLPLRPAKYGLNREMAVDLNALIRVGAAAVVPRPVGRLDDNEMRVIGERLVEHLDIDLEPVVAREVEERLAQVAGPEIL
jgi:mRNA-degrading endonuclease toxin of MazEF toxin-antitoxin module